jgi:hypothetical protein
MTNERVPDPATPEDFPHDYGVGAVSGVHPKLLVRKVGEVYVSGLTEEERYARYDNCVDLVNQLEDYCHRKLRERHDWSVAALLEKVRVTVEGKTEWDLSAGEVEWMMRKLYLRMKSTESDSPSGSSD